MGVKLGHSHWGRNVDWWCSRTGAEGAIWIWSGQGTRGVKKWTGYQGSEKVDRVPGEWRRPHKEEFYDLYCSPNIIWVIKSRRMRWAGNVASVRERRGAYRVLVGKPEWRGPLVRPRHRWKHIKMDLKKWVEWGRGHGLGWSGSGHWQVAGSCECSNEPSGSLIRKEFID